MVKEHGYILLPRFEHDASIHTPFSHLLLWKLRNMHDLSLLGIMQHCHELESSHFSGFPNITTGSDSSPTTWLKVSPKGCLTLASENRNVCVLLRRGVWIGCRLTTRIVLSTRFEILAGKYPGLLACKTNASSVRTSERQKYRLRQSKAWFWNISEYENCH